MWWLLCGQGLLEQCDKDDADTEYNEACILYKVSVTSNSFVFFFDANYQQLLFQEFQILRSKCC